MQKNKIYIKRLGAFELFDVLVEYDGPCIFVCKHDTGTLYLFSERKLNNLFEQWIAFRISDIRYDELLKSTISIQEAFKDNQGKDIFLKITHFFSSNKYSYRTIKKLPANTITKYNTYLKDLRT